MPFIIGYFLLAFICGYLGKNTRLGFWGVFLGSFLLTPLVTLIIMFFIKEQPAKGKNVPQ